MHFVQWTIQPLTIYQFSAVLNEALNGANLSKNGHFGTHSFRIGCATYSAMQGYSNEDIQHMGRWKYRIMDPQMEIYMQDTFSNGLQDIQQCLFDSEQ
jgi:hypothetical protein